MSIGEGIVMTKKRLKFGTLYGYGIGNLGYGMILQAMTIYLVFFGTTILKIPGSILGIIVSISVIWDAVSDPLMGSISDFTYSKRFGRRHLYILIGTVGVAFFNAALWSLSDTWNLTTKILLMTLLIFGIKTLSTVFVTPYMALSGELTDDYYERTTIQSVRSIFFIFGMAVAVVGGMTFFLRSTEMYPIGQMNKAGYMYLGYTASAVMLVSGLITYLSTKEFIPYLNSKIAQNHMKQRKGVIQQLKEDFLELFTNKDYLCVAAAYLSANLASAIIGSIGLHVFTFTFRMDSLTIGIILGVLFLFNILSQPFWIVYSKRKEKREAAMLATIIGLVACCLFLVAVFWRQKVIEFPYLLMPFSALAGFSVGGLLTLPLSMVGDTIDIEEYETGRRSEGLYYGGITFSYKASQSIAIFLIGILLDITGFNPELVQQTGNTELSLGLILAFGCILAFGLTLIAYNKYNLSHEIILEMKKKQKEINNDQTNE